MNYHMSHPKTPSEAFQMIMDTLNVHASATGKLIWNDDLQDALNYLEPAIEKSFYFTQMDSVVDQYNRLVTGIRKKGD